MNDIIYFITNNAMEIISILIVFLILKFVFGKQLKTHHSNWNTLIDNFEYSSKEFYQRLAVELKSHGITKIRTEKVHLNEGGVMSSSRLYLRVTWRDYQYDICGAPFGKGFFISWWMLYKSSFGQILISNIPFIGGWLAKKLYPVTYYRSDTASMFMSYAQQSVLKVIEDITKDTGLRALSEADKKPILNDIFKR